MPQTQPESSPQHESGNLPIMPKMCLTCPFGPNDRLNVRAALMPQIERSGRICHSSHTVWSDNGEAEFDDYPGTHICHGALLIQAKIMVGYQVLQEPTIAAWEAKRAECNMPERKPCNCDRCQEAKLVRSKRNAKAD